MRIQIINNIDTNIESILHKAGSYANICYSSKNYDDFCDSKANTRIAKHCIKSGHHSIFDHQNITFSLENIPKIIVFMLNNIGMYNTSEKSGRYTQFDIEKYPLYKKWIPLFENLILENGKVPKHIKEDLKMVNKLAMENARYFLPIDFPTNLIYTISIRNLCYLIDALNKLTNVNYLKENNIEIPVYILNHINNFKEEMMKTCPFIEELKLYSKEGNNNIINKINFFNKRKEIEEYNNIDFIRTEYNDGLDVYKIDYKCSYACLGQLQRHRTTKINIFFEKTNKFYIPDILCYSELYDEYCNDMESMDYITMGHLINIIEIGMISDFELKAGERLCSRSQLEICRTTKYLVEKLGITSFNRNNEIVAKCGTRKCLEPCKYGIKGLDRII